MHILSTTTSYFIILRLSSFICKSRTFSKLSSSIENNGFLILLCIPRSDLFLFGCIETPYRVQFLFYQFRLILTLLEYDNRCFLTGEKIREVSKHPCSHGHFDVLSLFGNVCRNYTKTERDITIIRTREIELVTYLGDMN